ncbi:hypothetical protein, partial [Desulfopila sp. IMCC35006]|uniref:hypothetical protein n=1 Tax=Desulfopila sp. IMCC35006 TaxID=2569542 RepID=UPI00197ACC34
MALQLNPNTTEFEIIEYFLRKGAKKDGFCTDLVKHGLKSWWIISSRQCCRESLVKILFLIQSFWIFPTTMASRLSLVA